MGFISPDVRLGVEVNGCDVEDLLSSLPGLRLRPGLRAAARLALRSTLTCPRCGHVETETMPTDACQYFYDCKGCGSVLKPTAGDCCVFCSYGDVPCPPIQETGAGCCSGPTA